MLKQFSEDPNLCRPQSFCTCTRTTKLLARLIFGTPISPGDSTPSNGDAENNVHLFQKLQSTFNGNPRYGNIFALVCNMGKHKLYKVNDIPTRAFAFEVPKL